MRAVPRPLSDPVVRLCANELRVLAQPVRIRVLDYLDWRGETNVQAMADALDVSQQNLSKHLGILHDAGLIQRRREGREVWYFVDDVGALAIVLETASHVLERVRRLADAVDDD